MFAEKVPYKFLVIFEQFWVFLKIIFLGVAVLPATHLLFWLVKSVLFSGNDSYSIFQFSLNVFFIICINFLSTPLKSFFNRI